MTAWRWISFGVTWVPIAWVWCYVLRHVMRLLTGRSPGALVDLVFFELRPFVPYLAIGAYLAGGIELGTDAMGTRVSILVMTLTAWWWSRNEKDDDDRWKRRRKALTEKVERVGGTLQVVPVEVPR